MITINRVFNIEAIFTTFDKRFEKDFHFDGESHITWEFVYVVEGTVGVAEEERIYKLSAGDAIFHKPMEFHRIWAEDGCSPRFTVITFLVTGDVQNILSNGVFHLEGEAEKAVFEIIRLADICRKYEDPISSQLAALTLETFVLNLIKSKSPDSRQLKTHGTQNYQKIVRVLNENYDKRLSAPEIAALCHLSLSNLKKIFKKYAGTGVMDYFNHLKITKAIGMFGEGLTMADISEALGYSSPNYFSECFKRFCGMTPTEYRKAYIIETDTKNQNT